MEQWKDIEGYNGLYQVSNTGKVISLNWKRTGQIKEMCLKSHNKGYQQIELVDKNGKKKTHLVHRLVATAFIENPNGLPMINHKDENKLNNNVENLEWCDSSYNAKYYADRHIKGRPREFKPSEIYHKRSTPIIQTTLSGEYIRTWENDVSIKHELGVNDWSITQCCRGKRKTAYGFKWHYAT